MTDIHSCSYYCERPECVRAQRDELRDRQWVSLTDAEIRFSAPEPEPLEYWNAVEGWVKLDEVRQHFDSVGCGTIYKKPGEGRQPLYPIPPQREWQGLTDEECDDIWDECLGVFDCLKMTEAKLKEKNT